MSVAAAVLSYIGLAQVLTVTKLPQWILIHSYVMTASGAASADHHQHSCGQHVDSSTHPLHWKVATLEVVVVVVTAEQTPCSPSYHLLLIANDCALASHALLLLLYCLTDNGEQTDTPVSGGVVLVAMAIVTGDCSLSALHTLITGRQIKAAVAAEVHVRTEKVFEVFNKVFKVQMFQCQCKPNCSYCDWRGQFGCLSAFNQAIRLLT